MFSDVERWPEWTASVTSLSLIDGSGHRRRHPLRDQAAPVAPPRVGGHRGRARCLVDVGVDVAGGPDGGDAPRCRAGARRGPGCEQIIEQTGPLGALVGRLAGGLTRRYLGWRRQASRQRAEAVVTPS